MPVYKYKAIDVSGNSVQGIVDAESIKTANEKLKRQGVYLSSLKEVNRIKSRKFFPFGRVSISELAISTRQFSTLISAGLP
ncbi:MAG: type II secretion system protein GspF, partial [Thermodesulfobacteriota bacterium]